MVNVSIGDSEVRFEPVGLSKLWTFSRGVRVPFSAIRVVRKAPANVTRGLWKGLRMPGTQLPGVIVAGKYLGWNGWTFWDVRGGGASAIELELLGHRFSRLVVDVADPAAEVERLRAVAPSVV